MFAVPTPMPVPVFVAPVVADRSRIVAPPPQESTARYRALPGASRGVAVNVTLPHIDVVVALGTSATLATGVGGVVPPSPLPPPHPATTTTAPTRRDTRIYCSSGRLFGKGNDREPATDALTPGCRLLPSG